MFHGGRRGPGGEEGGGVCDDFPPEVTNDVRTVTLYVQAARLGTERGSYVQGTAAGERLWLRPRAWTRAPCGSTR